MKTKRNLIISLVVIFIVGLLFLKFSPAVSTFLQGAGENRSWFLGVVILSSMIDSINPCAFSVLLLTIAFLGSVSAGRSRILRIGGIYILGIFVAYFLIGLGLLRAMQLFGIPHFFARLGASLVIIFGFINIIGHYFPNFPIKFKIPTVSHGRIASLINEASVPAAFILGLLVAVFEFPCTGGPYFTVLALLSDNSTYLAGFAYLSLYNIIFVLPLAVILVLSIAMGMSERIQRWRTTNIGGMKLYGGLAMILLGLLILLLS